MSGSNWCYRKPEIPASSGMTLNSKDYCCVQPPAIIAAIYCSAFELGAFIAKARLSSDAARNRSKVAEASSSPSIPKYSKTYITQVATGRGERGVLRVSMCVCRKLELSSDAHQKAGLHHRSRSFNTSSAMYASGYNVVAAGAR